MTFDEFQRKVKERVPESVFKTDGQSHEAYFDDMTITNARSSNQIWVNIGHKNNLVSAVYANKTTAKWPD